METICSSKFSKRESFFLYNTLLCLVKSLEKRYTVIDLRNEVSVSGKIVEVDGYDNLFCCIVKS